MQIQWNKYNKKNIDLLRCMFWMMILSNSLFQRSSANDFDLRMERVRKVLKEVPLIDGWVYSLLNKVSSSSPPYYTLLSLSLSPTADTTICHGIFGNSLRINFVNFVSVQIYEKSYRGRQVLGVIQI